MYSCANALIVTAAIALAIIVNVILPSPTLIPIRRCCCHRRRRPAANRYETFRDQGNAYEDGWGG